MDRNFVVVIIIGIIVILGLGWYFTNTDTESMEDENMATTTEDGAMDENSEEGVMVGGAAMLPSQTIVQNASQADNLTTLVQAVQAAELVDTLSSEGPFTVFAPTNAAFNDLPEGTVDTLLQPENQEQLASILTYHVVAGAMTTADLEDGDTLETVNGDTLEVSVDADGNYMVNGAMIQTADVIDSNGVSHIIDTVLMPGEDGGSAEADAEAEGSMEGSMEENGS